MKSADLLYRNTYTDFPDGCVAVVDKSDVIKSDNPISDIIEFSRGEHCRRLLDQFGMIGLEDYEVPEAECERQKVPPLSGVSLYNASVHFHGDDTAMLAHGTSVNPFLITDRDAVHEIEADFFGTGNIGNVYTDEVFTASPGLSRAAVFGMAGLFDDGAIAAAKNGLTSVNNSVALPNVVLEKYVSLHERIRKFLVTVPLQRFPTLLTGKGWEHGRFLINNILTRKDIVHSLSPLQNPKRKS